MCFRCPECGVAGAPGACGRCGFQMEADAHSQEVAIEWVRDDAGDRHALIAAHEAIVSGGVVAFQTLAAVEDIVTRRLREVGYLKPGPLSVEEEGDLAADEDRIERRAA